MHNMYYSFASVYSYCLKWLGDRQRLFWRVNAYTAVRICIWAYTRNACGTLVDYKKKKKLKLDSTSVGSVCVCVCIHNINTIVVRRQRRSRRNCTHKRVIVYIYRHTDPQEDDKKNVCIYLMYLTIKLLR